MRDLGRLSDAELHDALAAIGPATQHPPAPDVSERVIHRIRAGESTAGRARERPRWMPAVAAAAVIAVLATVALAVSPGLRTAVADWLGLPGIRIATTPDAPLDPGGASELDLGRRLSLDQARARVDFPLALPRGARIGPPDAVHLRTPPLGGQVSLVYRPRPGLPEAESTGVGLLLTQFSGEVREVFMHKVASAGVRVEPVRIAGGVGYWLEGRPHAVLYVDRLGRVREDTVRFADNVLLWERHGVVFRLESALGLDRALEIARSVR